MARIAVEISNVCTGCGAVRVDGKWRRDQAAIDEAKKHKPHKGKCGGCSGVGDLLGGYPRRSALGEITAR